MRKSSIKYLRVTALLLISVFISTVVHAEAWYKLYQRALDYIEKGQYAAAIDILSDVINNQSASQTRKRTYGTNFVDYYPYYYLGLCYFKLQNYTQALQWFKIEISNGAIYDDSRLNNDMVWMMDQANASAKAGQPTTPVVTSTTSPTVTATTSTAVTSTATTSGQTTTKPQVPVTTVSPAEIRVAGYIMNGKKYYNSGEYEKAYSEFGKALTEDKNNKDAKEWQQKTREQLVTNSITEGEKLEARKDYQGAIASYQKAEQYSPRDRTITDRISRVQSKMEAQRALAERKTYLDKKYRDALALYKEGRFTEAKRAFQALLDEDPNNTNAKLYLNEIDKMLTAQASTDAAKRQAEEFLQQAWRDLNDGKLADAKRNLENAGHLDSKNPLIVERIQQVAAKNHDNIKIGLDYYLKGNLLEAERVLKECAQVEDKSAALYAFIGSLAYTRYLVSGEKDDYLKTTADSYFRRALDLDHSYKLNPRIFAPSVVKYYSGIK